SASVSETDLRKVFEAYGRVAAVSVVRRGPRRHAFVEMDDPARARAAIDGLSPGWAVAPARHAVLRETQADYGDFAR
ncbi:MAG TPA: RNA-binding protein, partial [Planctomycetota bacterium]|nr:RNA-binding protein [Planctomycetota bacterium]